MTSTLIGRAEQHDYQKLFIHDLNWSKPDHAPIVIDYEGQPVKATNVSSYKGLRVWVVDEKPNSKLEAVIDQQLAKTSTDRIVIFHDGDEQVWRWPVRRATGNTTATRLSRHRHRRGDTDPSFATKLDVIRLPIDVTLDANAVLARVRSAFDVEAQNETKHASKLMARLYAAMEKAYSPSIDPKTRDHQISVTLARLLFLMFGDDTDMWPEGLFQDFILDHTAADGSNIGAKLTELFAYLDTSPRERDNDKPEYAGFRYVNGGIFKERLTLPAINAEFRAAVLEACDRDWATISPAIFGSMFQSVRDAKTRRELGEHYTSEENILKTLNPLFLDDLRSELAHIRTLGKYEADRLRKLRDKLGEIRYLDPACGCGNFIIVAYRELRDIELAIMERLQELTGAEPTLLANYGLKVSLDHFYGIEIDEWPARIAETAMFLIDRQCDLKLTASLGWAPDRLPIQEQPTIVSGRSALGATWTSIVPPSDDVVIAGNPPFLGISLRSAEQTEELKRVWGSRYHGTLDYVTGWHAMAMDYFSHHAGRWAFVATSSITQGEAVAPLFEPIFQAGWRVKFAHRTFKWTSEASGQAAVHCVIIGVSRDSTGAELFEYASPTQPPSQRTVRNISPYLTDGPSVIVHPTTHPLNPQLGKVSYGNKPTDDGYLIVEPSDYPSVASDQIAVKYLRHYIGAKELLHGGSRYCLWLTQLQPGDVDRSPVLKERINGVREFRLRSDAASTRAAAATPHLFRQIAQPATPYLCIPAHVSESRPYFLTARFGPETVASNANFITADPDGYTFAVISSTMFITWQRTVGGRLESRLRFNKLLTWNTFPVPKVSPEIRAQIVMAGEGVVQARQLEPDTPLADLYEPHALSRELAAAHEVLDAEVDRLFGLTSKSTELDRQDALFARYAALTAVD